MNLELMGINKGKVSQFQNKGIYSIEDLVKFLPRKYYDFRNPVCVKQAVDGEFQSVVGIIAEIRDTVKTNGMVRVKIKDEHNHFMYIVFFNQPYVTKLLKSGFQYIFCGKIQVKKEYGNMVQMVNPVEFSHDIERCRKIMPVYSKVKGMSDSFLMKSVNSALAIVDKDDYIEPELLQKFNIITYAEALRSIHQPGTMEQVSEAKDRFLFDDLLVFNLHLAKNSDGVNRDTEFVMKKFDKSKEFMDRLPFQLTDGQRTALREMSVKMKSGKRLNALVQGDVACGKTMVAILLMVVAGNNGYQSALMAPTNVLAKQHYNEVKERLEPLGFKVAFLSGEQKAKEKREMLKGIKDGTFHMIVGTHSIISKDVEFNNLALAVVDEEHRFGVLQRNGLREKAEKGIHTVTMSATPIPRSLALSLYGDGVDVMTIKSLPKGRMPVETVRVQNENKALDMIYDEVKKGRQGYIVCPLIEESDSELLQGVDSVEETYKKVSKYYAGKNVKVGVITGKMKQAEVTSELSKFGSGEYDVLIATTIIEVGVNVPNSTVILIKNAERFGLAQLHQLRGRVGRGSYKSYCLLLSDAPTIEAEKKIEAMCQTTDGFIIAQKDLEIRGTGDFLGVQQSGNNKYVMLMMGNQELNLSIKKEVSDIMKNPARFNKYKSLLDIDINDR